MSEIFMCKRLLKKYIKLSVDIIFFGAIIFMRDENKSDFPKKSDCKYSRKLIARKSDQAIYNRKSISIEIERNIPMPRQ
jgi:hypothetical protein